MTNREYIIEHLKQRIDALSDEELNDYFEEFASSDGDSEMWAKKICNVCCIFPIAVEKCTGGDNCPITIKQFMDKEIEYL